MVTFYNNIIIALMVYFFSSSCANTTTNNVHDVSSNQQNVAPLASSSKGIPQETLQSFESYPNLLNVTAEMRKQFHPIVKIPKRNRLKNWFQEQTKSSRQQSNDFITTIDAGRRRGLMKSHDYIVKDHTRGNKNKSQLLPTKEEALIFTKTQKQYKIYDVGRYDENRIGMYTSSLFDEKLDENRRTLHVGVDIGGPEGVKVYSFTDGVIHSLGYNEAIGDYGHVIVIEYQLSETSRCWALYGHLDARSIQGKSPGQKIRKGEVIGRIGNAIENGGWSGYHVHFQLAMHPPKTHDMPGVVSMKDREKALMEYPDPRYVLGELY